MLSRTEEDEDFVTLSYSTIDENSFCLSESEVVNVRNQVVYSFNGFPGDCSFLTSTIETVNAFQFETSPNPANHKLLISSGFVVMTNIDLMRIDGTLIQNWNVSKRTVKELDLPQVVAGLYFLCVTTDDAKKACQKIILQ